MVTRRGESPHYRRRIPQRTTAWGRAERGAVALIPRTNRLKVPSNCAIGNRDRGVTPCSARVSSACGIAVSWSGTLDIRAPLLLPVTYRARQRRAAREMTSSDGSPGRSCMTTVRSRRDRAGSRSVHRVTAPQRAPADRSTCPAESEPRGSDNANGDDAGDAAMFAEEQRHGCESTADGRCLIELQRVVIRLGDQHEGDADASQPSTRARSVGDGSPAG
jgi:hypothetical protein